jgi:hypothetical protein
MHSRNSSSRSAFYRARQREEVARSWFEQMSLSRWISSTASIHTWALRVFVDLDVDCRQPNMSTNLNMTSLFPRNDVIFDLRVSLLCSNGLGRHTLSCTMHTSHSTKLDKRSTQHSTQSRHTTSRLTPHSHDRTITNGVQAEQGLSFPRRRLRRCHRRRCPRPWAQRAARQRA